MIKEYNKENKGIGNKMIEVIKIQRIMIRNRIIMKVRNIIF